MLRKTWTKKGEIGDFWVEKAWRGKNTWHIWATGIFSFQVAWVDPERSKMGNARLQALSVYVQVFWLKFVARKGFWEGGTSKKIFFLYIYRLY